MKSTAVAPSAPPTTTSNNLEDILRTLVAMPTITSDRVQSMLALDYIEHFLKTCGLHTKRFEWDKHPALWATTQPDQKRPAVLLAAHLDVMPAPTSLFSLTKKDGKYFGRGVWDMKGALAVFMQVVHDLRGQLDTYDFGLMITTDEEIGGRDGINGVRRFTQAGYLADVVVLPDGGEDWQLETKAKGYLHYTLEAHGKSAHGSRPWEGENAILKLTGALHDIQAAFTDAAREETSFNVGAIESGTVPNKVPDYARAEVEMRPVSTEALAERATFIQDICAKHDIRGIERAAFAPVYNPLSNPYIGDFAACVEGVTGVENHGVLSYGGTDARFYPEYGVPVALVRPPGGGIHADDEWVSVEGLEQLRQITLRYLQKRAR